MRTFLTGEEAIVSGTTFRVSVRVKVQNGSGSMVDLSSYVERVILEQDIDQQAAGATVEFRRSGSATQSLSPFREDSTLNRLNDNTTYSPLLDVGRRVTIETATTAVGVAASGTAWKMMFDGYLDETDASKPTVTIQCRDKACLLIDRWIESDSQYGDVGSPPDLEVVIQQILDQWYPPDNTIVLHTPVSPSFAVKPYTQQPESIMDAISTLAGLPGWAIGYKWNESDSAFQLTMFEPDRDKTVPDFTFDPDRYIDVKKLSVNRSDIRNKGKLWYYPNGSSGKLAVTKDAFSSQSRYGIRFIGIDESGTSPIDTEEEAQNLLDAIISDLSEPKAEQEVEMHFFWAAELGDLYRFSANSVHYDTNQDWAVTGIRHELSMDTQRTTLRVRGNPAANYFNWLKKGGFNPSGPGGLLDIYDLRFANTTTERTYSWARGSVVDTVWAASLEVNGDITSANFATLAASVAPILPSTTDSYTIQLPQPGATTIVQLEPRDANLNAGPVHRFVIPAGSDGVPKIISIITSGTTITGIGDPDVASWTVRHTDGTWAYATDGPSFSVDVTQTVGGVAGQSDNTTRIFEVKAYLVPAASVNILSTADTRLVTIKRGTSISGEPDWVLGYAEAPAISGSTTVGFTIRAGAAPAGYYCRISERHKFGNQIWTDYADITADLSPAITAPPTTATGYSYDTVDYPAEIDEPTARTLLMDFQCEILNASDVVKATQTFRATWYSFG